MLKIDHVMLVCRNLYLTSEQLREESGLNFYEGGYFKGLGLAIKVVPLGNQQFLEIESVIDLEDGKDSRNGMCQHIFDTTRAQPRLAAWWVMPDDFDREVQRLDIEEWTGFRHRTRPDGSVTSSRVAPPTSDIMTKELPIWFTFSDMANHPGDVEVSHRVQPQGIAWLEIGGTAERLKDWLGPEMDQLPLRFVGGEPGIRALAVAVEGGAEIVIRPTADRLVERSPARAR